LNKATKKILMLRIHYWGNPNQGSWDTHLSCLLNTWLGLLGMGPMVPVVCVVAGNTVPTCRRSPCGVEGADFASRLLDDLRTTQLCYRGTNSGKNFHAYFPSNGWIL